MLSVDDGRADAAGSAWGESGQMTVEFAVVFPVMLVFAAVVLHALVYAGQCASFDEMARNAIRLEMENGVSPVDAVREIEADIEDSMRASGWERGGVLPRVTVSYEEASLGHVRFYARLELDAALFGLPLREVFGMRVPPLAHEVDSVVSPYRSAVIA